MNPRTYVRFALFLVGIAVVTSADSQREASLTVPDVEAWLVEYGVAWKTKDAAAVAKLFAQDALYLETPYADPFRGREGISEYWTRVTADQSEIDFRADVVGVVDDIGIARWSATFSSISNDVRVELNGVFLLEFDQRKLCSALHEWWHVR